MNIFEWGMSYSFNAYYEDCCKILNVETYHDEATLKKAYHKKVFETHPDKGGNTEEFVKVNEAYKFLSSFIMEKPKTSKIKDTIPKEKPSNIFTDNRKKMSIHSKIKNNNNKNENQNQKDKNILKNKNKNRPKNVTYKLEIELSDAYFGTRKKIKLNRNRICKKCKENNLLDILNENCEECNGKKYSSQLKEVQLIIKPGTYTGCKVNFKGEGEEYVGYEPGDIIFEIIVKENKNFLRKGSDLYTYINISIGESLGLDYIFINLFDKDKFYINKSKIIINSGETKTIIGKGFPFFDDNSHRGNLHIRFKFSFPSQLNLEQKSIIKNVFEGNYFQYIRNNQKNQKTINNNKDNIIKKTNIFKKINIVKKNENNNKQFKKNSFAPKLFNLNKKQNEKNKIQNNNNLNRSKSELNKSMNKKCFNNIKQNEKENNLNNYDLYDLVKFDETLINKGYFYENI